MTSPIFPERTRSSKLSPVSASSHSNHGVGEDCCAFAFGHSGVGIDREIENRTEFTVTFFLLEITRFSYFDTRFGCRRT
jgi:hypothetical protein